MIIVADAELMVFCCEVDGVGSGIMMSELQKNKWVNGGKGEENDNTFAVSIHLQTHTHTHTRPCKPTWIYEATAPAGPSRRAVLQCSMWCASSPAWWCVGAWQGSPPPGTATGRTTREPRRPAGRTAPASRSRSPSTPTLGLRAQRRRPGLEEGQGERWAGLSLRNSDAVFFLFFHFFLFLSS